MPPLYNDQQAKRVADSEWSGYEEIPVERLREFSPIFPTILDYIADKTGGKRLPQRRDIEPTGLVSCLPYLAILDVVEDKPGEDAAPEFMVRLMGTSIVGIYGEQTGRSVREVENKQAVTRIQLAAEKAMRTRQLIGVFARELSDEQRYLQAVGLYVPLVDGNDTVTQVLVAATLVSVESN